MTWNAAVFVAFDACCGTTAGQLRVLRKLPHFQQPCNCQVRQPGTSMRVIQIEPLLELEGLQPHASVLT